MCKSKIKLTCNEGVYLDKEWASNVIIVGKCDEYFLEVNENFILTREGHIIITIKPSR